MQRMNASISRRNVLKIAAGGAAFSALAGASPVGAEAKKPKVGFSFPSFEHFRWAQDRRYFEKRANEIGLNYIIQGAEENVSKQDEQVDSMLTQGVDAIILIPVNIESGVKLADRIKADAGIPVISYNYIIPSPSISYWCARDNYKVGRLMAEQALRESQKGNWAIVSGPNGVDVAQQYTQGSLEILKPYIDSGEIKIVSHEWQEAWSSAGALNQIENALTLTNNDLKAVITNEDGLALGALRAVREHGLAGKVWISGADVYPEVAKEIEQGNIAVSVWTDLIQMATAAADAALALANGTAPASNETLDFAGTMVPGMRIDAVGVTKQSLPEFISKTEWLGPAILRK